MDNYFNRLIVMVIALGSRESERVTSLLGYIAAFIFYLTGC